MSLFIIVEHGVFGIEPVPADPQPPTFATTTPFGKVPYLWMMTA